MRATFLIMGSSTETSEFIKNASDTTVDIINAAYHGKPLLLTCPQYRIEAVALAMQSHLIGRCAYGRCEASKSRRRCLLPSWYALFT